MAKIMNNGLFIGGDVKDNFIKRNCLDIAVLIDTLGECIYEFYKDKILPARMEFNTVEYYSDSDVYSSNVSDIDLDKIFIKDLKSKWEARDESGEYSFSLKDEVLTVSHFDRDGSFYDSFSIRGYRCSYDVVFCVKYTSKYISSLVDIVDLYVKEIHKSVFHSPEYAELYFMSVLKKIENKGIITLWDPSLKSAISKISVKDFFKEYLEYRDREGYDCSITYELVEALVSIFSMKIDSKCQSIDPSLEWLRAYLIGGVSDGVC